MAVKIAIVYHSGYGHTKKVAESIFNGVESQENTIPHILNVEEIKENEWGLLDECDAIIFGCPTYMGGPSGKFKLFIDESSKPWMNKKWANKIAAGFTNSGSLSGDKSITLQVLLTNAMQHGMIWVGVNEPTQSNRKGTDLPLINDINRLGSWTGLMTQSNSDSPEVTPTGGDLETARRFGVRIVEITKKFRA